MDKTLVFDSNAGNCGCSPLEAAALSNGGFGGANAMLPAMMMGCNGGFGGGMWNNPIWAIVFLAFLRNGGLWGDNNCGNGNCTTTQLSAIQETLASNQGQTLLMNAIQGNATSIKELASAIGCNFNAVQTAINGIQSAICNVGNQLGMSTSQIVNSINTGNMSIANQISQCCCDVKTETLKMGYQNQINNLNQTNMIAKGFGDVNYATQAQTNALAQNNDANTRAILAKLDQIEDSRKDREINSLTAQLAAVNARAERQAELAPINKALADIQCRQVSTITVPNPSAVAVPTCLAYGAGLYGAGQFGYNGGIFG